MKPIAIALALSATVQAATFTNYAFDRKQIGSTVGGAPAYVNWMVFNTFDVESLELLFSEYRWNAQTATRIHTQEVTLIDEDGFPFPFERRVQERWEIVSWPVADAPKQGVRSWDGQKWLFTLSADEEIEEPLIINRSIHGPFSTHRQTLELYLPERLVAEVVHELGPDGWQVDSYVTAGPPPEPSSWIVPGRVHDGVTIPDQKIFGYVALVPEPHGLWMVMLCVLLTTMISRK